MEKEEAREMMMRWGGRVERNRTGVDEGMLKEEKDVSLV